MSRLKALIPDLLAAAIRFPGPALVSAALAIYINSVINRAGIPDELWLNWVRTGTIAFFMAGVVHMFCEARETPRHINAGAGIAAAMIAGSIAHYVSVFQSKSDFLIYGSIVALMTAPYLRRFTSQGALWMYNMRLALVALFGFVSGLAVALALSAIYTAINYLLLDNAGSHDIWSHIWLTCAVFAGPFMALGLMPKDLNEPLEIGEHSNTILERGVRIIVSFVLIPLVVVFAGVLHVFAMRLLAGAGRVGGVQLNEVGTIVSSFVTGAAAVWLVAWPWRQTGNALVRLNQNYWFVVLVVPLALLVYALWSRVIEAGITANRYGLIIVAVWIAFLVIYAAWKRAEADMRFVISPLAAALLLGGFGPWGAIGTTVSSQFARLESNLAGSGVLQAGKLVELPPKLAGNANDKAYAALEELLNAGGLARIEPWFEPKQFAEWERDISPHIGDRGYQYWEHRANAYLAIRKQLGIASPSREHAYANYYRQVPVNIETSGAVRLAGPFTLNRGSSTCCSASGMKTSHDSTTISIAYEGKVETLAVALILTELQKRKDDNTESFMMTMSGGSRVIFESANAALNEPPILTNATFWVLWKP